MSFLERQQAAFSTGMASAASTLRATGAGKKNLAPPSPSPSVGSTTSATATAVVGTPRKDRSSTPIGGGGYPFVYSQPANTGTGSNIVTQIHYAVDWLRAKNGEPHPYTDVLGYLSGLSWPESRQELFVDQMRQSPNIQWIPDAALSEQTWRTGTYVHRPTIPHVRDRDQLLAYLQRKTDAAGVSVKDLKDGWPDCDKTIDELEKEHRLLVMRYGKDKAPKLVWLDDPTLFHTISPELKTAWHRVEVPVPDAMHQKLTNAGLKPTSEDPRKKLEQAPKVEKKKRTQRRNAKATNTHMAHLLKDFSHLKRG